MNEILGLFRRPQVVTREIDRSQRPRIINENGVVTLVPGFSKTGPFNQLKRISNVQDFEAIYGRRDRNLEFKGSYFHLSALNALRTGPILALALLEVDDELDLIDSVSMSASAWYDNQDVQKLPYSNVFNKQQFWELDADIYRFNVNQGSNTVQQTLHFANIFDRKVTLYVYKSPIRGFDVEFREWPSYPDEDAIPTHVDPKDLVSDHMVKVLIVNGDWTDTARLANDQFWSRYFNENGLRTERANAFIQEPSVNVLGNYDVSLVPYFVDATGSTRYIETIINANTTTTGIYVAHELYEMIGEPRKGLTDLIGETLTQTPGKDRINMLSYQTPLREDVFYDNQSLDEAGNVWGFPWAAPLTPDKEWRNGLNANYYIHNLRLDDTGYASTAITNSSLEIDNVAGDASIDLTFTAVDDNPYVVYDNQRVHLVDLENGPVPGPADSVVLQLDYPQEGQAGNEDGFYAVHTVCVNSDGEIYTLEAPQVEHTDYDLTGSTVTHPVLGAVDIQEAVEFDFMRDATSPHPFTGQFRGALLPTNSDIVLGVVLLMTLKEGTNYDRRRSFYYPVSLDNDAAGGFVKPEMSITQPGAAPNVIDVEFLKTTNAQIANSDGVWTRRNLLYYNDFDSRINNDSVMLFDDQSLSDNLGVLKVPMSETVLVKTENGVDNRSFRITAPENLATGDSQFGSKPVDFSDYVSDPSGMIFYVRDTELYLGDAGVRTRAAQLDSADETGVVGTANKLYQDYDLGFIGTDDVVHAKAVSLTDGEAQFDNTSSSFVLRIPEDPTRYSLADFSYANTVIKVETGTGVNDGLYEILDANAVTIGSDNFIELELDNSVINDTTSADIFFAFNQVSETRYIKAYKYIQDGRRTLKIDFVSAPGDVTKSEFTPTNLFTLNQDILGLVVTSRGSNFEQTLEIEKTYPQDNRIGVSAERYGEVAIGDYILAEVDMTALEPGEVPRYWTRIIDKVLDPAAPELAMLTTDDTIAITGYPDANAPDGVDLQTKVYKTLDNYVSEYVGFGLQGFKLRPESQPDGTQEQQDRILNMISVDTPLFKGLTNRRSAGGSWRYLVDTFGLGLQTNSKQQYADLCGRKLNCLGFISAPSERQFRESNNPSFLNPDGTLNYEYIRKGNNPNTVGAFRFTLADGPGRSNVGYFYPYMVINDNGIPLRVPPASYVHNTYRQKFLSRSSAVQPWTAAAGLDNGTITGISGVETDLLPGQLDELHDAHINPIFFEADTDYVIGDQRTAQIRPISALSSINVREMLISLEDELYRMLLQYQWKANTPELRQVIFERANAICQRYQDNFGLYAYRNVIDESNNTSEVIDDENGILDTYVEPTRVTATLVNNVYVLRTGDIESGGFRTVQVV